MRLDEESKKLTTFLLPSGRYRYVRGPMGLASSGDDWSFRSDIVITDIPRTSKIVDDILVAAKDYEELEQCLRLILGRAKIAKLALSRRKFLIWMWC